MDVFINYICNDLKIKVPAVVEGTPEGLSPTGVAATDCEKIYIRDKRTLSPDVFFSVAHEVRLFGKQKISLIYIRGIRGLRLLQYR